MKDETKAPTAEELAAARQKEPHIKKGVPGINRTRSFEDALAEQDAADQANQKPAPSGTDKPKGK